MPYTGIFNIPGTSLSEAEIVMHSQKRAAFEDTVFFLPYRINIYLS
jgi:hypothetical protein